MIDVSELQRLVAEWRGKAQNAELVNLAQSAHGIRMCADDLAGLIAAHERKHEWQFYANGTFCRRCGASIGSGQVPSLSS